MPPRLSIVAEEADETYFWIQFVIDEKMLNEKRVISLLNEAKELTAIFVAARKTTKNSK